ncbi:hypothetical protein ACF3DV_27150 [Chlorogloeopsis fritschii PCC 9212]|uniref:Uncharacterized protein n=1 Tax=Chlorogloeopsis fritschii PCC 6912 TaxID=211165 RepID=A0A3S1ABZ7_CHLFR|nr:hypothetical protein [Chlorogloeopsis fritschii]RUR75319.1 hypothetical protein PCC6912_48560 [Chlorogloeopsis fritschii PCC 6912]
MLSKIFQLDKYKYGLQLRITSEGNIRLNEFLPSGIKSHGTIAHITGIHYETYANQNIRIFDWEYYDTSKNRDPNLDKQIKIHLAKCNLEVINFLAYYRSFEINEDVGEVRKMGKNKRRKIKAKYIK